MKHSRRLRQRIKGSRARTIDGSPTLQELKETMMHMDAKDRALYLVMANSGLTIGEVSDIDLNRGRIVVRGSQSKDGEISPKQGKLSTTVHSTRNPYKLWTSQVCESENTNRRYIHDIGRFERWVLEEYGLKVREIPARWKEAKYQGEVEREKFLDELKEILKDYFGHLKGQTTPISVNTTMAAIVSYLHTFEIPVKTPRIKHAYVLYHNMDISKNQIRTVLDHSDFRNRAMWLLLYESGMRPETLVNLKWTHIKDEFLGHKVPMKIKLTSDILKCRVIERWTFIGEDGFEVLKRYLETRLPLKEEDYIFVSENPKGEKLRSGALSQAFNRTVQLLDLAPNRNGKPKEIRLYCLRKAFRKFMDVEEAYKEFWMGHTSTSTHYISTDPEYHRELYSHGYENLRLHKREVDTETITKLTRENIDLKKRVERLETILGELADLKAQIKSEKNEA